MKRWLLLGALAVLLLSAVPEAQACQICRNARVFTVGQKLDAADQAVLAVPEIGQSRFRILEIIKGKAVADQTIEAELVDIDVTSLQTDKPVLLTRYALAQRWSGIGAIDVRYAGWLRSLAENGNAARGRSKAWPQTTQPSSELTDEQWQERAALVLPYVENPEPLAAEIAYGELARAPYATLRTLKPRLQAAKIATWIDDPQLAGRSPAYILLLGIAGNEDDAVRLEQRINAAWQARDATNLAAMLAADLELRGPSRLGFVEAKYFADRGRTMPEIEAALLALNVHGSTNAAVPRARVIEAYRLFIRERKPMAGFVAQQLADWECWDTTADYVEVLKSDAVKDPVSHFAIVNYLQRSPYLAAKAALQSPTQSR